MVEMSGMIEAYFACRKSKRRTASAVAYEVNWESRLVALLERINMRTYEPSTSVCFVVSRPRLREVFAADFEDRIIHHYIALRLEPLFEELFCDRTFNCRKGKGTLYGVEQLKKDLWDCSEGYKVDCWILKLDLQSFFMSIEKARLARMIDEFIVARYFGADKEDLRYLCRVVVMHCPEKDCERRSDAWKWERLPKNKSLFTNGDGYGVAIGNLFAQLFANFYLDGLDKLIGGRFAHHGRYVDDFYIVGRDKAALLGMIPVVRAWCERMGLRLHPRKVYLQHYAKGVEFTGAIVKPWRVYAVNRAIFGLRVAVWRLGKVQTGVEAERAVSAVNSYLGLLGHYDEYGMRRKVLMGMPSCAWRWVFVKGSFECLCVRPEFRLATLRRIRDGSCLMGDDLSVAC